MNFIKHFFGRHLCVENIYIDACDSDIVPVLRCKECGREIGFIHSDGIEWKVFIHVGFRRYKLEIERWAAKNVQGRESHGTILEQQWGALLSGLRQQYKDGLYTVGCEGWTEESEEDSYIEDPTAITREDNFELSGIATVY